MNAGIHLRCTLCSKHERHELPADPRQSAAASREIESAWGFIDVREHHDSREPWPVKGRWFSGPICPECIARAIKEFDARPKSCAADCKACEDGDVFRASRFDREAGSTS